MTRSFWIRQKRKCLRAESIGCDAERRHRPGSCITALEKCRGKSVAALVRLGRKLENFCRAPPSQWQNNRPNTPADVDLRYAQPVPSHFEAHLLGRPPVNRAEQREVHLATMGMSR